MFFALPTNTNLTFSCFKESFEKALIKIFEFQTADEQENEHTYNHNGVGFTGIDGQILTSFAKQLIKYKRLSDKQMDLLFKKMPKYWKQVLSISDKKQIEILIQG